MNELIEQICSLVTNIMILFSYEVNKMSRCGITQKKIIPLP